jgi:DNA-binding MarR family transcriptional regulator
MAALDEALRLAGRYVLPAYESSCRWCERIRATLVALLSFLEDEPYLGRLLVVETLGAGDRTLRRRQQVLSHVLAAVDEGRGEARASMSLPPLTAEGAVGAVLSVLHARLAGPLGGPLLPLTGQLTSMLVLPYLGAGAAQRELQRPLPERTRTRTPPPANPLHDLGMRLTYRTVRVLLAVASQPGASNRELAAISDIQDQGQMSKLLTRLEKVGLIENTGAGHARGAPNAWRLTDRGRQIEQTLAVSGAAGSASA